MWDFDNAKYHPWTVGEGLNLPTPVPVDTTFEVDIEGKKILIGVGIHDSSASLAPYFAGSRDEFFLVSTGTWCINMNPFNSEKLTAYQLSKDCLCYMSITRQPVKSTVSEITVKKALPGADQAPEVLFYNPRRPYPYRTGEKSKHKSYKEAIQTLAKKYDRSPEWVKLNMGVTNDLNEIHKNLAERKAADPS